MTIAAKEFFNLTKEEGGRVIDASLRRRRLDAAITRMHRLIETFGPYFRCMPIEVQEYYTPAFHIVQFQPVLHAI